MRGKLPIHYVFIVVKVSGGGVMVWKRVSESKVGSGDWEWFKMCLFIGVLTLIFVVFFVAFVLLPFIVRHAGVTMCASHVVANPVATIVGIAVRAPVPSASIVLMSFIGVRWGLVVPGWLLLVGW